MQKELPRIPYAPDFWAFSRIGRALADLHVGYEQVEPYPLAEELALGAPADPAARYRVTAMRWGKDAKGKPDRTTLQYNEWITLRDIPPEAFAYQVNGRAPVEWVVDQ